MIDLLATGSRPMEKTAVAVGLFDGLHTGHTAVIKKTLELCKEDIAPAMFTFETGTLDTKCGGIIISEEMKRKILSDAGIRYYYSPEFADVKELLPEEFVESILVRRLDAKFVVSGENFRFGKNGSADASALREICREYGIEAVTVPMTEYDGSEVSSTRIRSCLEKGEIEKANKMLGRAYAIKLPVVTGNMLGRELNFPTINQEIPDGYAPLKRGVYAAKVEIDGVEYDGAANLGVKPTVSKEEKLLCETHIFGITKDLYGKVIEVRLTKFIRGEKKFSDVDELQKQVLSDIENIRGEN